MTYRTLLQGIKTRLEKAKETWADELYHVLWAYRTTQRLPTGETPFALAFGMEAVIPIELNSRQRESWHSMNIKIHKVLKPTSTCWKKDGRYRRFEWQPTDRKSFNITMLGSRTKSLEQKI